MPKELGLFYVDFLTVPFYIQWDQFIIFQVTFKTPYHQVPSNFMLGFKILHMNLLNILTLLTLKVSLGDHPTRPKNVDYLQIKNFKLNPNRDRNIFFPTVCALLKKNISRIIHQCFSCVSITRLKRIAIKVLMEVLPENIPGLE